MSRENLDENTTRDTTTYLPESAARVFNLSQAQRLDMAEDKLNELLDEIRRRRDERERQYQESFSHPQQRPSLSHNESSATAGPPGGENRRSFNKKKKSAKSYNVNEIQKHNLVQAQNWKQRILDRIKLRK